MKVRYMTPFCAALLLVLSAIDLEAQTKEPISHESLWMMKRVGSPSPSPDGSMVVFSVTEPAYDEKDQVIDLWIAPVNGSAPARRLTSTKGGESDVAWSPDSRRIAFVAKREGDEVNQIYVLSLAGGDPIRITSVPMAARTPRFSPDGAMIAFQSAVYPGATDVESNRKIVAERKEAKFKVRIYEGFPIRRWDRWLDDARTHLLVVSPNEAGASPRDLLAGTSLSAPGFAAGPASGSSDSLNPAWAPDGRSIVVVATLERDRSARASVSTHLFEVPLAGGEIRQLTTGTTSYDSPQFSPDGRRLLFRTSEDHSTIYALNRLASSPWPWTGETRTLTAEFDRSVGGFAVTPDSRTVYFTAEASGLENIYSVPAAGGKVDLRVQPQRGVYTSLTIPEKTATPILIANWGSSIEPNEIVRIDPSARTHRALTSFATAEAARIDWQPLRHFTFTTGEGRQIHSMMALPPGFDESKKYPLFVLIHGGAHNMWRDAITLRWNYHLLAQPGYIVLLTDYRGSTGYGEQFSLDILGDPLKGPAEDINAAADEAIRQFPFIDGFRQAAGGASYGGHLANWLQGTTTRYKALISHAGLANLESQWGTSDVIYGRELMAGGPPWEQSAVWREQNPIRLAGNFKTPMLLSVGENDFRVPLNQTIEMWSALQRMQVPSRLLVWPDENHWILKPENSRVFYQEVHGWLGKWVGGTNDE